MRKGAERKRESAREREKESSDGEEVQESSDGEEVRESSDGEEVQCAMWTELVEHWARDAERVHLSEPFAARYRGKNTKQ